MRREISHSRAAALVALGAFAVHQLHFLLVSGSGTGEELREAGYSFIGHVPPTLAAFAVTVLVARLALAYFGSPTGASASARSPLRRCAFFALSVFAVYVAQETLEAALFAHHADTVLAALGQGSWLALLLAACLGPVLFALDRWITRLEELVAEIGQRPSFPPKPGTDGKSGRTARSRAGLSPLAFGLARRPPPLARSLG